MQTACAPIPMSLDSGRRRRSSISEHIQRVFHIDRPDRVSLIQLAYRQDQTKTNSSKKRQSCSDDGQFSTPDFALVHHEARSSQHQNPERTINNGNGIFPENQSLSNEAEPRSFPSSSQSAQLPRTSTDSSPAVNPPPSDGTASQSQSMEQPAVVDIKEMRNTICVSPTWEKISRKERRATKRLEAERKELEKRLQQLEEDQSRFDHGIYERNSRRLTKKQPLSRRSRTPSVTSDRPRSFSGSFSSFFSVPLRPPWSRSSSVDGRRLRRRSADAANPPRMETSFDSTSGPPVLPLILPECFGTAITRELASRSPCLLPSPIQSNPVQPSLHTTTKSEDLHESWKMAQAWKRSNGGHEMNGETSGQKRGINTAGQDTVEKQDLNDVVSPTTKIAKPPVDLDVELFTVRRKRKSDLSTSSTQIDNPATQIGMPSLRKTTQPDDYQHLHPAQPLTSKVTTARQMQEIRPSVIGQGSTNTRNLPSALTIQNLKENLANKSCLEATVHNPRIYKSSPLASNRTTTDDIDKKGETKTTRTARIYTTAAQSSRFWDHQSDEESRGRSRLPVSPMETYETAQNRPVPRVSSVIQSPSNGRPQLPIKSNRRNPDGRHGRTFSFDSTAERIAGVAMSPPNQAASTPAKRPVVNATVAQNPSIRAKNETKANPVIAGDGSPRVQETNSRASYRAKAIETPGNAQFQEVVNGRENMRSRASSRNSSQGPYSNYETADEETPSTPSPDSRGQAVHAPEGSSPVSVPEAPFAKERLVSPRSPPESELPSQMNTLREKPAQKGKARQKDQLDQLVAKVFVICCRCRYWHDMPSEVYAQLTCPERLPVGPRSRNSTRRSTLSSELLNNRKMPSRRFQSFGANSVISSTVRRPSSSLQCCWCGHNMGKSCCQGWTTIVQMRERHH